MTNKKTVLIVEDNDLDRKMMCSVLEKKGFTVFALSDGNNCLELIQEKKPDLVLLDILMPNLHGNHILHLLREKYNAIELPILMTTVKAKSTDVIESLALGANDYIIKPIDFDVALMRINTQLTIQDQSRELSRLRVLESVTALVATYNHEINNPLAIAISSLKGLESLREDKSFTRLEGSLWRIADIVKKVKEATAAQELNLKTYGKDSKILKLK